MSAHVFFKGYGFWKYTEDSESVNFMDGAATYDYEVSGIFQLEKKDELEYKYTGNIKNINRLLPCNHPDDEFKRAIRYLILEWYLNLLWFSFLMLEIFEVNC